ncbi:MAG: hypothetical protein OEW77_04080 [Gemmatimonadota bacterium]|nr:hypothetical protein [Gemmatimonadota bacterium]
MDVILFAALAAVGAVEFVRLGRGLRHTRRLLESEGGIAGEDRRRLEGAVAALGRRRLLALGFVVLPALYFLWTRLRA